jgi:hypothetical protein
VDPELTSRYWTVRKVVCLVGYFGGLRNIEMRSIEFGKSFSSGEKSFDMDANGYWFTIQRGKQRGLPVVTSFCVPRRQSDWASPVTTFDRNPVYYDPASVINHYLRIVELDLNKTRDQLSGGFFKSAHGKNAKMFRNVPMGKNLLEKVGREFAEELGLQNPATFTSHCWRRSCGTNASDAGVNVTTLMSHLGWTTPKTAIGYCQKSRRTSLNVSTFLSNVQRENKDLDQILGLLKTLIPGTVGVSAPKVVVSKKSKSVVECVEVKPNVLPDIDGQISSHNSTPVPVGRHRESEVGPSLTGHPTLVEEDAAVEGGGVVSSEELVQVSVGNGSGGEILIGPGGGSLLDLDPRISSILSNLQNHGQLHVHFHFGK